MRLQIINAYVDTLNHVEEVGLQDERLPRMVEHASGLLKFLEILSLSSIETVMSSSRSWKDALNYG